MEEGQQNQLSTAQPSVQPKGPNRQVWVYITAAVILITTIGFFIRSLQTEEAKSQKSADTQEQTTVTQIPAKRPNKTTIVSLVESGGESTTIEKVGETVTLDLMLDPGRNQVTFFKIDLRYDPTRLSIDDKNGFNAEKTFESVLEGPTYDSGKISATLSTGDNPKKAITSPIKAATLTFKTLASTEVDLPTLVDFGSDTTVLSIAPDDAASENVISTINPARITIEQ